MNASLGASVLAAAIALLALPARAQGHVPVPVSPLQPASTCP